MQDRYNIQSGVTSTTEGYSTPDDSFEWTTYTNPLTSSEQFTVHVQVTNGDKVTPNPLKFEKLINYWPSGKFDSIIEDGGFRQWSYRNGPQVISLEPSLSDSDLYTDAYNSALESLYEQLRGQLDLSVSLLEGGQTIKMLKAVSKVGRFLTSLKDPKEVGNNWLQYQYGWKPLLTDVFAVADKLVAKPSSPDRIVRGRATKRHVKSLTQAYMPGFDITDVNDTTYRAQIAAHYTYSETLLNSLAGWSSLNPISIAWELTPYSFVSDWFIDIGSYLRATESALLYDQAFRSGTMSEGYRIKRSVYFGGGKTETVGTASYITSGRCERHQIASALNRVVLTGTPYPRLPSFKADLGSSRLFSAAALLSQFIGKDPVRRNPDYPTRNKTVPFNWDTIIPRRK